MRQLYILHFTLLLVLLQACKSEKPSASATITSAAQQMQSAKLTATTTNSIFFAELPSASGLEYAQGSYFVIGDDSPFLYRLDKQFQLVERHALFDSTGLENGRIPKSVKPDLESMAHFTYGRDDLLLLFGSGSSEARNKAFLVNLSEKMKVQELDLSRFYTFLKRVLRLQTDGQLNVEGLAMDDLYAYMLQRPVGAGVNTLLRFEASAFKDFILGRGSMPAVAAYHFALPQLGRGYASFSGAYALGGKLFFTASVEDTPNAIEDGEVLGSFVGMIDLRALPYASDPSDLLQVPVVQLRNTDGTAYIGKAESLVVLRGEGEQEYRAIVVSDDDQGHSELLEVKLGVEYP